MTAAAFRKLTPVLTVDAIEPCLPLWLERLGWQQTVSVPEGDRLGFVILEKDGLEVMYQTWTALEADLGTREARPHGGQASVVLFIGGWRSPGHLRAAGTAMTVGAASPTPSIRP